VSAGFVDYAGTKVRKPCRIHPNILAVMDVHNLRRDEHMIVCAGCFARWLGNAAFDMGIDASVATLYETVRPFASEVASEHEANEREKRVKAVSVEPMTT
jgi:hypothetical protein